ncbi:hypothetical protein [Micromonospora sp. NPDC126480]|uniref:hypothetical protein n=1 Tax=Micromonospora sp. NPDC126480 TaxID=3155312 RepID=UPI0033304970
MTPDAPAPTIRPARREDVPAIVAMVHELAAYERAPDSTWTGVHGIHLGPAAGFYRDLAAVIAPARPSTAPGRVPDRGDDA